MKLALVAPWFGRELLGGAERLAADLSDAFAARGHDVTVLTTCSRDWRDPWDRNTLLPGTTLDGKVRVSRFRVDRTNTGAFREINRAILSVPRARLVPGLNAADEMTEAAFVQHNIVSTSLLAELARTSGNYDRVLFLPYLYGTTLRGWHIPRERSVIVPCLHGEAYAYLGPVAAMMRGAPLLLFNSAGEYELARKIYGPSVDERSAVVGSAVDPPRRSNSREPIGEFDPEGSRYVLFLGRNRPEKNIELLLDAYRRFAALEPDSDLRLVLAGEETQGERGNGVIGLGPVDDDAKARLIASARALVQPSANESFSRVLVEAWSYGRPAIVHGDCLATAIPMRETRAGWIASSVFEWQRALHIVDQSSNDELAQIGARASIWLARNATWPAVIERYEQALAAVAPTAQHARRSVVHVLSRAAYGDVITNTAFRLDAGLRSRGRQSAVVAVERDPRLGGLVRRPNEAPESAAHVLYLGGTPGGPPPTNSKAPAIALVADAGSPDALSIARSAKASLALNEPALRALRSAGVAATLLPPAFDAEHWNVAADQAMMEALRGSRLILCVAQVDAASGLIEILETFSNYLTLDFDTRLAIVGPFADSEYEERLRSAIENARLEHRIFLPGVVSIPALAAFYRTADLFVCNRAKLSTGQSLVDAMAFGLPVCAAANEYTRALMGPAGVLVNPAPPIELAALWRVLIEDKETRETVIAGQRRRLQAFASEASLRVLEAALEAAE